MEHRSLTIVFTDIKGFTSRTSEQSRGETLDMIKKHRDLVLPVITERGGNLIKSIGDAFLFTFESPTDAVLSGIKLQQHLRNYNKTAPKAERVEIRVAINTGEVIVEEGDVYGETVNIASRIEGIAEPNEVYFTEATYLSMNKSEVPSAEIGYRILKGIPEKIKVYKVLREGEKARGVTRLFKTVVVEGELQVAAHWRRILAFGFDIVAIGTIVILLLNKHFSQVSHWEGELNRAAEELQTELIRERRAHLIDVFRGRAEPEPDMVYYERVQEFLKDKRAHPGSIDRYPELKRRGADLLADIRNAEGRFLKEKIIWGNFPLPDGFPLFGEITEFRQQRDEIRKGKAEVEQGAVVIWGALFLLYSAVAIGWWGRTLGKRLFKIRVVGASGQRCGWGKGILRTLLYLVSALPFLLGFLWALFNRENRTWHDMIVDTRVVYVK